MIKTRVLLCEDEEDAREILEFYLNTIFEEVVTAEDGAAGLEIYKKERDRGDEFDLILTDINMPNMDGIAMLEAIYDIDPKQKFIIVSAHKDEDLLIKSINLRVLGYFTKPLNVDNIMELLKKAKIDVLSEKQRYVEIDAIYRYNTTERLLYENDTIVKLSKKETEVLSILMHNKGKIVDVDRIKLEVWGTDDKLDTTLRTIIKRLKDKITKSNFILSRKGLGYMIE